MMNSVIGKMDKLIIHFVGNKNNSDGVRFSDDSIDFNNIEEYLNLLINNSFKSEEFFQFYFLPNIELNPVFQFVTSIFQNSEVFIEQSQNIGRYLYDKSNHPQIKAGELCIAYYKNCLINNSTVDCIGIFKSENKDTVLKIEYFKNGCSLKDVKGINIRKLDKGCLIFNSDKDNGYLISLVDNTNRSIEAQYWKDEFLSVMPKKNEYHQTNQFLGIAKQFVTKQLQENFEMNKTDQINFLNSSVEYFKKRENFVKEEFEIEVFGDKNIIESFRDFEQSYRKENEIALTDNFKISPQAVKKQARVFKSVLKLDKNFDIYIHGDRNLIKQGIDENGRKYYIIYYQEES